jgi:hypothetical protein
VVKQGIIRNIESLIRLINQRDSIVPLQQRQKPPLEKEVMFTWHLQVHMQTIIYVYKLRCIIPYESSQGVVL